DAYTLPPVPRNRDPANPTLASPRRRLAARRGRVPDPRRIVSRPRPGGRGGRRTLAGTDRSGRERSRHLLGRREGDLPRSLPLGRRPGPDGGRGGRPDRRGGPPPPAPGPGKPQPPPPPPPQTFPHPHPPPRP